MVGLREFLRRAQARSLRVHRMLTEVAQRTPASPALLHDLHRELRRARLDVRVLSRSLPKKDRATLAPVERTLKELSDRAGEARDRDVLERAVLRVGEGAPRPVVVEARALAATLHREGRALRNDLRSATRRALSEARHRLPPLPPPSKDPRLERRFTSAVEKELAWAHEEFLRARRRAARRSTVKRLHALRISVRRLRHLRTSLAHRPGSADLASEWRELQQDLGVHHDLGVLDERVRSLPRTRPRRKLLRLIHDELGRRQRSAERGMAEGDRKASLARRGKRRGPSRAALPARPKGNA